MTLSILIVDDNLSLANLYQIVFERNDWQVRRESGGQAALDSIAADMPDVVLLDVMMPNMDGIEVCRRIRADWPKVPPCIAIYTANNRPEVREACLAAGADLFFSKNLTVFELPDKIDARCRPPSQPPATPSS
ncbi:MAG: response regulator [Candidatus Promineofilum sp.]|nr:response regulator [Promineifilum sp.]